MLFFLNGQPSWKEPSISLCHLPSGQIAARISPGSSVHHQPLDVGLARPGLEMMLAVDVMYLEELGWMMDCAISVVIEEFSVDFSRLIG